MLFVFPRNLYFLSCNNPPFMLVAFYTPPQSVQFNCGWIYIIYLFFYCAEKFLRISSGWSEVMENEMRWDGRGMQWSKVKVEASVHTNVFQEFSQEMVKGIRWPIEEIKQQIKWKWLSMYFQGFASYQMKINTGKEWNLGNTGMRTGIHSWSIKCLSLLIKIELLRKDIFQVVVHVMQ